MLLEEEKVRALLERLCTKQGLCLPEATQRRPAKHPAPSVNQFVDTVLSADGLIPANVPSDLYNPLHEEVARAFAEAGQQPCPAHRFWCGLWCGFLVRKVSNQHPQTTKPGESRRVSSGGP